ncbi:TPA: hypothetical protein ACH3X2_003689 [Trebouxia sp. C0005]
MPVSRFQVVQLGKWLKLILCRSDIDDITPNFGCDLQAGPSGSPVLEVGAGAASSSSLTVIPHDTPSVVPSSLSASAAAAGSDGVKASSSGGAAASGIGDDKKSVLGLHEKMRRHTAARRKDSAQVPVPTAMMKGLLADSTSKAMAGVARQAVRENDMVKAALYEEQANAHWLKHYAAVMQYAAHMRPALPAFPFPHREPGPPMGFRRDPNVPAWAMAAPAPAQAMPPQEQRPAQPHLVPHHLQPQPVPAQPAQAQPPAQQTGTAQGTQAVQPEAQAVPSSTNRLSSIIEQMMPLVAQMSCNILAMQSTKDQVPGPLETVLADMEAKKDDMETCLGLLLELASGMAEAASTGAKLTSEFSADEEGGVE